jgi:diaminopimelate decarboxylase
MLAPDVARSLLRKYASPLYAYDLDEAASRARTLHTVLPAGATIFYSLKANPLPALVRALKDAGCSAEVSSTGELAAALEAGVDAARLLYGGPGKTSAEMNAAITAGVRTFSCESWVDVGRLDDVARRAGVRVQALLRVNPTAPPQARLAMTGVASQFGFEEEALAASSVPALAAIDLVGVHVYYGTQVAAETLVATTANALEAAARIAGRLGFECRIVDAGGGFPWPYASPGAGPDLEPLRDGYAQAAASEFARSRALWFESGRYLAAASGTLLATVLDVKESKGKKFVVLDTGINHLGGMSGLGRIARPAVGLVALDGGADAPETVDVVGPLCSPLDSLGRGVAAPRLRPGDAVAVPNVGAYGLTASLLGFLGHPAPIELALRGGVVTAAHRLRHGHARVEP